jgi:TatD DNase family protein
MLIDTHAHLDYPEFEADFDQVLRRANEAGVTQIITIGTSVESSSKAVTLAEKYPSVFAVIGVHPTSEQIEPIDAIPQLRELARNPRVVAIGETGLDYHHLPSKSLPRTNQPPLQALTNEDPSEIEGAIEDGAYKARQSVLFQAQLDLAAEFGLNVVVHQRDAWDDTLAILRPYTGKLRGVFHCFGNTFAQAQEVIGLNHMVSFTGIVTFKNAPQVQEVASRVATDAFMVETDCPYLAPVPFRGKRCEPAHTRLVAEAIAKLRGVSLEELGRQTTENARGFFRFPA